MQNRRFIYIYNMLMSLDKAIKPNPQITFYTPYYTDIIFQKLFMPLHIMKVVFIHYA